MTARVSSQQRLKLSNRAEAELLRYKDDHALWHKHVHNVVLDPMQILKCIEMDQHPNTIDYSARRTRKTSIKELYAMKKLFTTPFQEEGIVAPRLQQALTNVAYHTEAIRRSPMMRAYMPVPPEAQMMLRVYLEHPDVKAIDRALPNGDHVLFPTVRNRRCPTHEYRGARRRFNRRSINEMIAKYGKRAGIPTNQLHPHALRHLYGTELAEGEVDLLLRQRLMGHADPKTTAIYTGLAMRKLTAEAHRANPLAKMRTPVTDILKRMKKK
jgi:hypothetical protein